MASVIFWATLVAVAGFMTVALARHIHRVRDRRHFGALLAEATAKDALLSSMVAGVLFVLGMLVTYGVYTGSDEIYLGTVITWVFDIVVPFVAVPMWITWALVSALHVRSPRQWMTYIASGQLKRDLASKKAGPEATSH